MAFKKTLTFGKTKIEGIATIKKIKFGSKSSPITAELHVAPDPETYKQLKEEELGYKIDDEGKPLIVNGKRVGVTKTLDYEKTLLRIDALNSRDLGPEKDKALRTELLALFYKYFAINPETGNPLEEI